MEQQLSPAELPRPKKQQKQLVPPPLPNDWDRCHAFLPKKMRYCRQLPVALPNRSTKDGEKKANEVTSSENMSMQYCGNHLCLFQPLPTSAPDVPSPASSNKTTPLQLNPRRIPCPLDPTHTVLERRITDHLRKCPATKRADRQKAAYYYTQDINRFGHGDSDNHESDESTNVTNHSRNTFEWAQAVARRVLQVHATLMPVAATNDSGTRLAPHEYTRADISSSLPLREGSDHEPGLLMKALQAYHVRSGGPKHVFQQASIVGHLKRCGVWKQTDQRQRDAPMVPAQDQESSSSVTVLEVGAGRGMTGLVVAGVAAAATSELQSSSPSLPQRNVKLIMVERQGARSKADTILRKANSLNVKDTSHMNLNSVEYQRIHCDLCHVNVANVMEREHGSNGTLVVVAKHLCGVGTDYALKAIEPVKDRVSACFLATCCHGACNWEDYVGRDYLRDVMQDPTSNLTFGSPEFNLLRRWSGGTVLVAGELVGGAKEQCFTEVEDHHESGENGQDLFSILKIVESLNLKCGPQGLGRACQRLIDYGRLQYMKHSLFPGASNSGELFYYVHEEVTPQNAALMAHR